MAVQLRDDLSRYLRGEPVQARTITRDGRSWRWCKRNRVLATLSAAVATLLMLLAIGGPLAAVRQASLRAQANALTNRETAARLEAGEAKRDAEETAEN